MRRDFDSDEPGFDPGEDEESTTGECECCGVESELQSYGNDQLCEDCAEGYIRAGADLAAERRAERAFVSQADNICPSSDRWDD